MGEEGGGEVREARGWGRDGVVGVSGGIQMRDAVVRRRGETVWGRGLGYLKEGWGFLYEG